MKTEASKLTGAALDWAVARLEFPEHLGYDLEVWVTPLPCDDPEDFKYQPSTDWSQGGPIIEREDINVTRFTRSEITEYGAEVYRKDGWTACTTTTAYWMTPKRTYGPTPLIAAMRCYVTSKLGEFIDIPEGRT